LTVPLLVMLTALQAGVCAAPVPVMVLKRLEYERLPASSRNTERSVQVPEGISFRFHDGPVLKSALSAKTFHANTRPSASSSVMSWPASAPPRVVSSTRPVASMVMRSRSRD
jgi:hypothetical protein